MMFKKVDQLLRGMSPGTVFVVSSLLVVLIGLVDYAITFELDIFYLFPIFIVTWYGGRHMGITITVFATFIWAVIDKLTGQFSPDLEVAVWNIAVEFGFFLAVVVLFSTIEKQAYLLEELATQDPLTGIANRRSFLQALKLEARRCQRYGSPFTLIYVDVDNFKAVNDTQGHNAGDALLRRTAALIQQSIRDIDLVGRLGGDEFGILLPGATAEAAQQIMGRTRAIFFDPLPSNDQLVTLSIGAVTFLEAPPSIEDLLGEVDAVMYSAKRKGKDRIVYKVWPST